MKETKLPIPIYQLGFLQAYLYEIFSIENKCQNNFDYTRWYLNENFSPKEIELIFKFFEEKKLCCDCDILRKLDLREMSMNELNFHD